MRLIALMGFFVITLAAQSPTVLRAPARGWINQARSWTTSELASITDAAVSLFEEEDGARTAVIPIVLPGAVRLHFDNFHLPAGARVCVYGWDGRAARLAGIYTAAGPLASGEFWSDPVSGERAVVEVHLPADAATLPFTIRGVGTASEDQVAVSSKQPFASRRSWFNGRVVEHQVAGGFAVVEGDIILGRIDDLEEAAENAKTNERQGVGVVRQLWPNGIIPYTIDRTLLNPRRITDAIAHWNQQLNGSLRLQERGTEAAYLEFLPADPLTCSSYVGRTGAAAQPINIGDYCATGNIIHEIGHAIGLYHEHTRRDRDTYVQVQRDNVDPTTAFNFDIVADAQLLAPYDYGSIMHYGAFAFSRNGLPTISTIPEGIPIGQRRELSAGDIASVRQLYPPAGSNATPSTEVRITIASNPAGRSILIDGVKTVTPATLDWLPGSSHIVSAPDNTVTGGKYVFASWSDAGAWEHAFVTPTANSALTVSYEMRYNVTVTPSVPGHGEVTVSPESSDASYPANTSVSVSAAPEEGFCFSGWSGMLAVNNSSLRFTVTRAHRITAAFQPGSVTVPAGVEASAEEQGVELAVAATSGCLWNASTGEDWMTIQNVSGKSSAIVKIKIAPNPSNNSRSGVLRINGRPVRILQRGNVR